MELFGVRLDVVHANLIRERHMEGPIFEDHDGGNNVFERLVGDDGVLVRGFVTWGNSMFGSWGVKTKRPREHPNM